MKVRIKVQPAVREIDGIDLSGMTPGMIREVSPIIGAWLIVEGYAEAEMRRTSPDGSQGQDGTHTSSGTSLNVPDRRSRRRF